MMQWTHREEAVKTFASNFQNPYSDENPFYTMFGEKYEEASKRPGKATVHLHGSMQSQMMAYQVNAFTYDLYLSYVGVFQTSVREEANVLLKCRWNKQTGKLTQVDVQYSTNRFDKVGTRLTVRRTGTIEQVMTDIADALTDQLSTVINRYWDGFVKHYSKRPIRARGLPIRLNACNHV
jgi:hypothetical protein